MGTSLPWVSQAYSPGSRNSREHFQPDDQLHESFKFVPVFFISKWVYYSYLCLANTGKIFIVDLLLPVHTQNYRFIWYQSKLNLLPKCRGVHSMSLAYFGSFIYDKGHSLYCRMRIGIQWCLERIYIWDMVKRGVGYRGQIPKQLLKHLSLIFGLSIPALLRLKEMLSVNNLGVSTVRVCDILLDVHVDVVPSFMHITS